MYAFFVFMSTFAHKSGVGKNYIRCVAQLKNARLVGRIGSRVRVSAI